MKYKFDNQLISSFTEAMNRAHTVEPNKHVTFSFKGRLYVLWDDGRVSVRTVDGYVARSVSTKKQINIRHTFGDLIGNFDNGGYFTVNCKTSVEAALKLLWASIRTVELGDE